MHTSRAHRLRPVRPADSAFLLRLFAANRAAELMATRWSSERQMQFLTQQFEARQVDYARRFPTALDQIVLWGGEAVGRLLMQRSGDEIHIVDIALLPVFQRRGIGRDLLRGVLKIARHEKVVVSLTVDVRNRALTLYQCEDFVTVGRMGSHLSLRWTPPEMNPPG
ncbi:GNAT family N-acetyltransferase [Synoicihabitans lomoniglobus]|uniref:GNAT family N-acetyltransferase n=1 Tax=Synoicihabitans lomoniglobus TaxID=2909285 RepID=A0AAF0CS45_9BACT|nr:GNAT family N-acetyltransferase [Opitutaceae bacterium LMO-M01]